MSFRDAEELVLLTKKRRWNPPRLRAREHKNCCNKSTFGNARGIVRALGFFCYNPS